jgi:1-acyl-sn-glycerol-3-phosphate acyltransferase
VCLVRDLTYPPVVATCKVLFKVLGIQFKIAGTHHIPRTGGAVLAVNHVSYVDFIFAGLAAQDSDRLVRFMAKKEVFDHPVGGPVMRSLHHIPVDRDNGIASYRMALRYLKDGELVGVFPEATISRSMELKEFKSGTVRMASAAGVPLIPIVVWGTQRLMTKDHPRDFRRGHTISVTVGAPLHPTARNPTSETEELRASMSALLDSAIRTHPEPPQGQWWAPVSYGGTAPTPEEAQRLDEAELAARAARRAARGA